MPRMMKLGLLLHTGGQHIAAWRHPEGVPDAGFNLPYYQSLARSAEAAKLDFIFTADISCLRDWPTNVVARCAQTTFLFEPMTLMTSLSAVTDRIGFVVTASTTYNEPYSVARQFASLDLLSGGRAAWNIVTGTQANEARNYGRVGLDDHGDRYRRAAEFADVVKGFWQTRDAALVLGDKETGLLFDSDAFRPFRHSGEHYQVDGVLNVPPSPQGRPILVQAGASGPGRDLAASVAEVIFASIPDKPAAQDYYRDVKTRMREKNRDPAEALIMPGIVPIIGRTPEEARAKLAELDSLIHPDVSIAALSEMLGIDLSPYDLDGSLPAQIEEGNRSKTMVEVIRRIAGHDGLSIREMAAWVVAGMTHLRVVGTAEEIANVMQSWFEDGACDGFLVSPLLFPAYWEEFAEQVLPILRERGLFRREYEGTTLRENLGLAMPTLETT